MTDPILGNPDDREPGRARNDDVIEQHLQDLAKRVRLLELQANDDFWKKAAFAKSTANASKLAAACMRAVNFSAGVHSGRDDRALKRHLLSDVVGFTQRTEAHARAMAATSHELNLFRARMVHALMHPGAGRRWHQRLFTWVRRVTARELILVWVLAAISLACTGMTLFVAYH